jgi:2-C-methyl-D-erythritol 4-phosphate cytidylyltransferase
MSDIKKFAVLVAGGQGTRMGMALPKQFLPLNGKPILSWSIIAFTKAFPDINIILVLPPAYYSYAQMVLTALPEPIDVTLVSGGETRFHSVKNGLSAIEEDGIVFVHDGARPLITTELLHRCYNYALTYGSAIPAIPVAESMRIVEGDTSKPVNRDHMRVIQTPQTFKTELILPAFKQDYTEAFTDEATVAEAYGITVHLCQGEKQNIKVTTPEDMIVAEAFMASAGN